MFRDRLVLRPPVPRLERTHEWESVPIAEADWHGQSNFFGTAASWSAMSNRRLRGHSRVVPLEDFAPTVEEFGGVENEAILLVRRDVSLDEAVNVPFNGDELLVGVNDDPRDDDERFVSAVRMPASSR